ncbi:hypothetical protein DFJ74DRAFT_326425 [Hyaloraphidium curvatum]|nr:hypothetical protein DFJ74DRAFT_326425 [Hyaloraphidium curvatum]
MEALLLLGAVPKPEENLESIPLPVRDVLKGQYSEVLRGSDAESLFGNLLPRISSAESRDPVALLASTVSEALAGSAASPDKALSFLCVGIAALKLFVQHNWTGPSPTQWSDDVIFGSVAYGTELASGLPAKLLLEALSADNEEAYGLTRGLTLLVLALGIFSGLKKAFADQSLGAPRSLAWWRARALFVQQRILDNPAATLFEETLESMEEMEAALEGLSDESDLRAFFFLEYGLVYHYHKQDQRAKAMLEKAQQASGLHWLLSGALGKRTRFQQQDKAQLIVVAESRVASDAVTGAANGNGAPSSLMLNDDLLLESIKFADGSKTKPLRTVDQGILLAHCLNVRNTNPAHGLTQEEMLAYVSRILDDPNRNFSIYTMALILRSRLESTKSRTVERSILQLQALVDQYYTLASSGTTAAPATAAERLALIWSVDMPPIWQLEREVGERWMGLGMAVSALEIFERLHLWEDAIECYQMLEKAKKAEELIRKRLEVSPNSPKLWCLLGDVTGDPRHWEHAWEISEAANRRFSRAMRSLGRYWFKRNEWRQSMDCYSKALAINPLFENSWFILGCAALQVEDFDTASMAFTRVVSLNHENAEAWTNLAAVHIRQRKAQDAYVALQQALKQDYENWKIWQNYLYVATDLNQLKEAVKALERIVELRWQKDGGESVDKEVLGILTDKVIQQLDGKTDDSAFLAKRMAEAFESITDKVAGVAAVWTAFGKFRAAQDAPRQAIECYQKAYRTLAAGAAAESSEEGFSELANAVLDYANALRTLGPRTVTADGKEEPAVKDWAYQARMVLRTTLGRAKNNWEGTAMYDRLSEALAGLKT